MSYDYSAILPRSFYEQDTEIVARLLLGKLLVRVMGDMSMSGIIVETEAYTGDDPACHAYRGKTKSNQALFGRVGCAYVYFIYGMHYCLNIVARDTVQSAGGVLIRAIHPLSGITHMQTFRKSSTIKNLTNGPGKLAQALAVGKNLNECDVTIPNDIMIIDTKQAIDSEHIITSGRIGLSKASEVQRRYYVKNNPWVSHNIAKKRVS